MSRDPLRNQLREQIRQDLVDRSIRPGEQIRLEPLAERHSVSITPTREALTQLEAEGWVVLQPNRGFFAAPMTRSEGCSIYPVLSALEVLAVELGGPAPSAFVERLRRLNERLDAVCHDPDEALEADRRWHELLVSRSGNPLLQTQLRGLRARAARYERAYMAYSGKVPISPEDHEGIIDALEHDVDRAVLLLRDHWSRSVPFLREWLNEDDEEKA